MPVYTYRCPDCGEMQEIAQSIHDDALTICPLCGRLSLKKVYGAVGLSFKGTGFYSTDNRSKA